MSDELIDIFNDNNILIKSWVLKSQAHKKWLWHRAVHIWIYNSKWEILIQLRANDKDYYPDVWDVSVAGHVWAWEEVINWALREIEEEIWIKVEKRDLNFWKIINEKNDFENIKNNEFHYIYFLKFDWDITKFKLQKEEVQEIKFIWINDLNNELNINPQKYLLHWNYWLKIILEIEKRV